MPSLDTSKTYQAVVNTEPVTYFVRLTESTFDAGHFVQNAKRRAPTKDDDLGPGGAELFNVTLFWHLWRSQLFNVVPKTGDVIQDYRGGKRWTVAKVEEQSLFQRFRLTTYKEQ